MVCLLGGFSILTLIGQNAPVRLVFQKEQNITIRTRLLKIDNFFIGLDHCLLTEPDLRCSYLWLAGTCCFIADAFTFHQKHHVCNFMTIKPRKKCHQSKLIGGASFFSQWSVESSEQFWHKIRQIWHICELCQIIEIYIRECSKE